MLVSHEPLGVHRDGLKSPHWVNEVLFFVLWERGCPETDVGHLTLKNASLNPDITWLPESGPSWEPRPVPSQAVAKLYGGGRGGGGEEGQERRGALRAPPDFMPQLSGTEEGLRKSGREGEAWSRTHLLEMLVWVWPEAHLPGQEVWGHKPGKYLTWKAALVRKRTSATANIDPTPQA